MSASSGSMSTDEADEDHDPTRTPPTVIGSVAAATVVVPFLMVYAFLFIVRGLFVTVEQPDITGSRHGEALAGLVALAFLLVVLLGMSRLINGHDRWVLVVGQLVTFGVSVDFLVDSSSGDPQVPVVTLLASALAVGLALVPRSWQWVRTDGGQRLPRHERHPDRQHIWDEAPSQG